MTEQRTNAFRLRLAAIVFSVAAMSASILIFHDAGAKVVVLVSGALAIIVGLYQLRLRRPFVNSMVYIATGLICISMAR